MKFNSIHQRKVCLVNPIRLSAQLNRNIELEFFSSPSNRELFINANFSELNRALSNVINNAVEEINDQRKITVSIPQLESVIELIVQDNGIGIPEKLIQHLGHRGVILGKPEGSRLDLDQAKRTLE